MKKKTSKITTKNLKEKKPLKKSANKNTTNKKKDTKKQTQKKKQPEVVKDIPPSKESQAAEEELLKKKEVPKIKTYELMSEEEIPYTLNFELVKDKLRINVTEKDSFPQNEYENFFSLEDLIKIDKWFKIFYNIENLLLELEQLTKNENFVIERKKIDVISLYIVFPINLLDKIEILLPINEINNKDLFFQLISKINEVESKEKNDIIAIDEKLDNLEHLLNSMEQNNNQEEEKLPENHENENNDMNTNEENMNNLEEMKDALKQQIENKIKISNDNQNNENEIENENEKLSQENSMDHDLENKNSYLLIDQNQIPFQESTILSEEIQEKEKEIGLILEWLSPSLTHLPNPPRVLRTKLIYKAEIDGDKASTFHEKCDNVGPTIIIIQTKEGFRYGGYTSVSWEAPEQSEFKADPDAFIFSLDTQKKYECLDTEKSIQCSMYWGPYFGEGGTICVPDNFLGETNAFYQWPSTYNIPEKDELTLGQEHNINIKDYEVYTFDLNSGSSIENE